MKLSYSGNQSMALFIHDSHSGNTLDLIPIKVRLKT